MSDLTDILADMIDTLSRIETRLASIDAKTAAGGASSVNLKTSTRGHDIDVKTYPNSPVTEAGNAAVEEYFRLAKEIERRLMGQGA